MYQKLQHNFLSLLILTGLLILGGQSFAQEPQNDNAVNDTEMPAKSAQPQAQQVPDEEEGHNTKDLEQLLKRYNTDSEKVLQDTSKLHTEEAGEEVDDSEINEMRPSDDPMKVASVNALKKVQSDQEKKKREELAKKSDYSGAVRLALEPLQKLSEKELLRQMDENTKTSPMRPYIDQFPNIIVFAVKLIKDKESLPSLAKIAEDRDRLIRFAGIMVATLILGFFLKKLMHREGRSFIKAAFYFLLRMYMMFAIRVYIVYYFFSAELTPAAKVFKQTFM